MQVLFETPNLVRVHRMYGTRLDFYSEIDHILGSAIMCIGDMMNFHDNVYQYLDIVDEDLTGGELSLDGPLIIQFKESIFEFNEYVLSLVKEYHVINSAHNYVYMGIHNGNLLLEIQEK